MSDILCCGGAAAFVNLLARLLVFSVVGANKKLRMSLERRIVQSPFRAGGPLTDLLGRCRELHCKYWLPKFEFALTF